MGMVGRRVEGFFRFGSPGSIHHLGEGIRVQVAPHMRSNLRPDTQKDALPFVLASTVFVGLSEIAGYDRTVYRRDDLGKGNLRRRPGKNVPATDAPLRAD